MNDILEYRKSIVKAKKVWDAINNDSDRTGKKIISEQFVFDKQEELGIYGGAIALLSKAEGKPFLLYSPDVQRYFGIKNISEYQYLNTPYDNDNLIEWIEPNLNYFIDLLFFISRDTDCPEYVKNINDKKKSKFEYLFQFKLRDDYEILHCSAGEVLFFTLLWRLTIELLIRNRSLRTNYSFELFNNKYLDPDWVQVFESADDDLVERLLVQKLQTAEKAEKSGKTVDKLIDNATVVARSKIQQYIREVKTVKDIFSQLNIFKTHCSLDELNKYVEYVFSGAVPPLTESNSEEFVDKAINEFIKKTLNEKKEFSIGNLLNLIHEEARFPILPYYFLILFDKHKKLKEHIVFPLWYTFSRNTRYLYKNANTNREEEESAILHALYTIKPIWETLKSHSDNWYTNNNEVDTPEIEECFEKYLTDLFYLFSSLSKPIVDSEYYSKQRDNDISTIKRHATKSAVAAVMSRNMSHNIGSHVLSKLSNLDSKSIRDLLIKKNFRGKKNEGKNEDDLKYKHISYWIDQGKIFYSYLQKRLEFIADISTSETIITNASLFQNEILNNFKTVGRSDQYPHFIADFISGVEGVDRKTLKVKGFYKDKTGCYNLNDHPSKDIFIDLPNDTLGAHALYVMLENIIRNASKHNKIKGDLELKLIIEDSATMPGYYEISVVDNQHEYHEKNFKERLAKNNLPEKINTLIDEPILDNGKVRDLAWGILELKICAAYLAKKNLELLDTVFINKNRIIQAAFFDDYGQINTNNTHFNFGYKFWLRKPKLVLIVSDDGNENFLKDEDPGITKETLNNKGIYFENKPNLRKLIRNGTEHEYLVIIQTLKDQVKVPVLGNDSSNQKIIQIDSSKVKDFKSFIQSDGIGYEQIREYLINLFYSDFHPVDITTEFENQALERAEAIVETTKKYKISPTLVIKSKDGSVIFDSHGEAKKDHNLPKSYVFYEPYGSQSGTGEIISKARKSKAFLNELVYAAISQVVLLDERIQENTTEIEKDNLKSARIFIPSKTDVNLMKQSFGEIDFENTINGLLEQSPEYFIIHLGIIEKFLDATDKNIIQKWIERKFKLNAEDEEKSIEQRTKLIIISGRGKPPTLPKRSLYLPYSLVAQCILPANQSSKLKLIQLLSKARRYE